jgi:hypothetical protein
MSAQRIESHFCGRNPIERLARVAMPLEAVIPLRRRAAPQYLLEPLGQTVWRSFREN